LIKICHKNSTFKNTTYLPFLQQYPCKGKNYVFFSTTVSADVLFTTEFLSGGVHADNFCMQLKVTYAHTVGHLLCVVVTLKSCICHIFLIGFKNIYTHGYAEVKGK